ncbi:MAG: FtsX-like permease family protein [bacterium]|nr:FtsX-like permease family protein [bacterium]
MTIVLRSFLRSLFRRRSLTLFQLAGVACGVAAVVGMLLASDTALTSFRKAVRFLQGSSTHALSLPVGPMPESVLTELMADPGVTAFAPVLDRQLGLADGSSVRVLGLDPFLDHAVRPDLVFSAEPGDWEESVVLDLLLEKNTAILESRLAQSLGAGPGTPLVTGNGVLKVLGTFTHPVGEPIILMDIAHAQEFFGAAGKIDRVDLILEDPPAFAASWSSRGYQVASQGERQAVFEEMLRAFRMNLEAMSLLALMVGVFLVYNTSMFSVISRRKSVGVLRSLGATRLEIVAAVTAEISLLGALGGAAGGVLGFALAHFLTGIVGDTINRLYFFLRPLPPRWSWSIPLSGAGLGLLASLLGGAFSLFRLSVEDPVKALTGRVPQVCQDRTAWWTAAAGLVLTAASVLVLAGSNSITTGYIGAFGVILGLSFMCGVLLIVSSPAWKMLLRTFAGPIGPIAAGNVRRSLGRTAVAVAAFGIALSLLVGLGSMIGSFRRTLIWWMEGQIRADYYIQAPTGGQIPLELYPELARLPGVGGVDPYQNFTVSYRDTIIHVVALDPDVLYRFARFAWYRGDDLAWKDVKAGGAIVSESFYRRFGLGPGGEVTLTGKAGERSFAISAIFYDYTTEHGLVMMSRESFLELFGDPAIDTLAVFLEPEGNRPAGTGERVRDLARGAGMIVADRTGFEEKILGIFDATFTITHSMRAIAVIVAFFGITGALLTLFMERRKEFGIYRALGLTGREVALMTLLEGLGMGLAGFILSAVAGTAITFILIRVINVQSFNWTIFYYFDAVPYLTAAVIALSASAGAAVFPMIRVVRTYPQLQIREE